MFAPAQDAKHAKRVSGIVRFFQDVLIEDDDRVGSKHKIAVYGRRLGTGKPEHIVYRRSLLPESVPERRPSLTSKGMPACSRISRRRGDWEARMSIGRHGSRC